MCINKHFKKKLCGKAQSGVSYPCKLQSGNDESNYTGTRSKSLPDSQKRVSEGNTSDCLSHRALEK